MSTRLDPQQLVVLKLFEIADRLADQVAIGIVRSETITVGTEWTAVVGAWVSATIYNDGTSDIYVRMVAPEFGDLSGRPWEDGEAPLKSGDGLPLDLRGRSYKVDGGKYSPTIWMICKTGSASVRIFKLI